MTSETKVLRVLLLGALLFPASRVQAQTEPARLAAGAAPPVADLRAAVKGMRASFVRLHVEHRTQRFGVDIAAPTISPISGILFDRQGHILTVGHVLKGADLVSAENCQGEIVLCKAIGYDPGNGVAVLRMDAPAGLKLSEFLRDESLELGQPLIALGNPFSLGVSVASGHVTGLARTVESLGRKWHGLVQVSLPVNPGDQGGPVGDLQGRVVAMLLTRYRPPQRSEEGMTDPQGISFAIPIGDALKTAEMLIELHARRSASPAPLHRPWLGVRVINVLDPILMSQLRLEKDQGVLVERVFRNSPAERAGLRSNDVIILFDNQTLSGLKDFGERIHAGGPGARVAMVVIRGGRRQVLDLVIGER